MSFPGRWAIISLLGVACTPPAPAPAPRPVAPAPVTRSGYGATEARIFDLVNSQRTRRGLPELAHNPQLDQMAMIQAQNMARFQRMAHVLPESSLPTLSDRARHVGYPYREIAENIALGYPSADRVVEGWMNSSGHRANILNRGVVETGIAVMRSRDGGLYYCQVFGRRLTSI